MPGIQYPRVPDHEVIGIVDAVGAELKGWTAGQRVGVGWHGGNCGYCDTCRRGDPFACETESLVTGITSDGGYADYMIARAETLARVPEDLSNVGAAPARGTSLHRQCGRGPGGSPCKSSAAQRPSWQR